jgi:hypothetical protein
MQGEKIYYQNLIIFYTLFLINCTAKVKKFCFILTASKLLVESCLKRGV